MTAPLLATTRLRKSPRSASRVLDGQAVIVLGDSQKLFTLNSVGTDVFELADGRTVDAIVDAIVAKYEVDRAVAERDVVAFATRLVDTGAIVAS